MPSIEQSAAHLEYRVEPLSEAVLAAHRRFFPDNPTGDSDTLRRWRFERNPHGPAQFALAIDRRANDRIVGMIILQATRLRRGDDILQAYQAIDTIVDPDYRGHGIFVGLGNVAHQQLVAQGAQFLWGFPNENAAPGWFGRLGWSNFGTAPFVFRPLRTGYLLRRVSPALAWLDLPLARHRPLPHDVAVLPHIPEEASAMWREQMLDGETIGVDRTADWLTWRLFDRPSSLYRTFGLRAGRGDLTALVSTCVVEKHGGTIVYVMEALARAGHTKDLSRLLRVAMAEAARQGAEVALGWCATTAPNRTAYRRAGFFDLPDRLRPVTIGFGARALGSAALPHDEGRSWYLSYLDSDTL